VNAAVLFDFGGTLDADGVAWKERFFRLYLDEGVEIAREQFDAVFYRADDALVGSISSTRSLEDTVARLAAGVTESIRPGDQALAARVAHRFLEATGAQIELNRPLLGRLAERYHLGIVSNFYGNLPTVCDNLLLRPFFRVIVDSTQVGLSKPDPRIFRKAVEELAVPLGASVFVGDSFTRDMAGALAVGMRHVWLVGDEYAGAEPCCPGDGVVRTLREVEAFL